MRMKWATALLCAIILLGTTLCISQSSVAGNATLKGWVKDDEGNFISSASVKVYKAGSNVEDKTTSTNSNGYYELPLQPGKYDVRISKEGYAEGRKYDLNLPDNYTYTLNATLPKQSLTPQIDWNATILWSVVATIIVLAIIGLIYLGLWLRDRRKRKEAELPQHRQFQQYQQQPPRQY